MTVLHVSLTLILYLSVLYNSGILCDLHTLLLSFVLDRWTMILQVHTLTEKEVYLSVNILYYGPFVMYQPLSPIIKIVVSLVLSATLHFVTSHLSLGRRQGHQMLGKKTEASIIERKSPIIGAMQFAYKNRTVLPKLEYLVTLRVNIII